MQGKSGGRRLVASALIVLIALAMVSRTAQVRPDVSAVERLLGDAMAPFQSAVRRIASPFVGISREIARLRTMSDENLMMRDKVLAVPWLETDLLEARLENQRLRELLKFGQSTPHKYVPALVIARNPDAWLSTVTIDRGSADGVARDDAVVAATGVVGRVIKVTNRTSTVMLLTDPDSGVGSLVERSRDAGVLVGQIGSKTLRLKLFSKDADVKPGDVIITSGLGSLFPKGLPIGKVISVGKGDYGLVKTADVAPLVNFDRLEEVLVVKSVSTGLESIDR